MTRSTRASRPALAAILAAGCLVAPTAMAQAVDKGQTAREPSKANVYVPPSPDTATRQGERWLQAHGGASDAASSEAPTKADVYVPPAQGLSSALDSAAPTQTIAHPAVPSADDGASPWVVIGLALRCAALLGSAGLALAHRRRARRTVA